ncbi:hypothetical protein TWF718_009050 [Orbilia javanica]|uniref:CorA-like transporter domain-containing protein n=1 Tax=Orbilia javanica TaxID=47235 RepID=A0AAN8MLJ6_9PEZI
MAYMAKFEETLAGIPNDAHQRRFQRHASDLFAEGVTDVECLRIFKDHQYLDQRKIKDSVSLRELSALVEENQDRAKETFYIIWQKNTLSPLKISEEGLRLIIDAHELSYVVRYVECHGRTPKNPWSVRQTGVCQQTAVGTGESVWVLLQPSATVFQEVKYTLEKRAENQSSTAEDSCSLHLDILESLASSWADYVEWSWEQVDDPDSEATLSKINFPTERDIAGIFNSAQKAQRLRRRLLRAISVLDSNYALADGIAAHFPNILTTRIANYKAEIHLHRRNLHLMMEHLKGTSDLLFSVLSTLNDKVSLAGTQAMQQSLGLMGRIAQQGRDDSTTLKLLSMIATIYLPASLVATIFSSNLIELKTDDNGGDKFHVVSQFWLYILVAVALTVLTFICGAFVLRRKILESLREYRAKLRRKTTGSEEQGELENKEEV